MKITIWFHFKWHYIVDLTPDLVFTVDNVSTTERMIERLRQHYGYVDITIATVVPSTMG